MSPMNRKVQLVFGSAILTLLIACGISYRAIIVSAESQRWVEHSHEVLEKLQDLLDAVQGVESGDRAFALTGQALYLESYRASIVRAGQDETIVRSLTADNFEQQRRLSSLDGLIAQKIQFGDAVIGLRRTMGLEMSADAVRNGPGQKLMEDIQVLVREIQSEELRLLALRNADAKRRLGQTKVFLIFGTIVGILIATGAGGAVRRYDFAERLVAEEAIREGENRFGMLANNMSQLAWMADEKGSIFWYNDRWFEYSGTTLEEMAGWG